MQQLIDVIRAAIATDANSEQKAAGVQACRTIVTALDTEPGKPLTLPGVTTHAGPRVSIDQVLDLVIARLNMIATDRDQSKALPASGITPSLGLRIPMATGVSKVAMGPATTPPAASRSAPRPSNPRPADTARAVPQRKAGSDAARRIDGPTPLARKIHNV